MHNMNKSLPMAIGLNVFLPGLGYLYMGRWVSGIIGGTLIVLIFFSTGIGSILLPLWLGVEAMMAIDMVVLFNKRKEAAIVATTIKCPRCAETIQRDARICRFCQTELSSP